MYSLRLRTIILIFLNILGICLSYADDLIPNLTPQILTTQPLFALGSFFVAGLLLAFTPCVFPLLPVLIAIISGKNISSQKRFFLALSYILGGAVLYAGAGVIAAILGSGLLRWLQSWWVSAIMAGIFILLALAMLEKFTLQLPQAMQNKLNRMLSHYNNGSLFSTFITGGVAGLILSPCVTPPLAGALIYISSTGNILLGGSALFALGIGSGIPLLIMALFGQKILPKTGSCLIISKQLLALLMLGVAAYLISKTATGYDELLLLIWGAISVFVLGSNFNFLRKPLVAKIATLMLALIVLTLNAHWDKQKLKQVDEKFMWITTVSQLEQQLQLAKSQHKPVILDFYASWCSACKELDIRTFSNPEIQNYFKNYALIRVDVSNNTQDVQILQNRYQIFALPSIIILDKNGLPVEGLQTYGYINSRELIPKLQPLIRDLQPCDRQKLQC